MPTNAGAETIQEKLTRLRTELSRVRATISRAEENGSSFSIGGSSVTQIAYERALKRQRTLENEIARLEARLAGSRAALPMAQTITRIN